MRYDYQRKIYAEVTAGAFAVEHAADAPGLIDRAIDLALRRRKPVMLEIACNLAALAVPAPRPKRFDAAPVERPRARWPTPSRTPPSCSTAPRGRCWWRARSSGRPERPRAFRKLADASGYAVAVLPGGKGMFPEDHPAFAGIYWGPVSWPGVAAVVESADAYLFAGTILSDYATTGFTSALIDPKRMLLAMPDEVRLPGATLRRRDARRLPRRPGRARCGATTPRSREFRAGQKPDRPGRPRGPPTRG